MAEKSDTVQIVMFISAAVNDRRNDKPPFLLMLTSLANTNVPVVAVCKLTDQWMILLTWTLC